MKQPENFSVYSSHQMGPAIVILGDRDISALEDGALEICPDAEVLVQSGSVPEVLALAVATHRPRILVLDSAPPEAIGDIPTALEAAEHADVAVGTPVLCWRRDVLSAALTSRTRFAHMRRLLHRAARHGASFVSFKPSLASHRTRMLSWPWEADEATRTRG